MKLSSEIQVCQALAEERRKPCQILVIISLNHYFVEAPAHNKWRWLGVSASTAAEALFGHEGQRSLTSSNSLSWMRESNLLNVFSIVVSVYTRVYGAHAHTAFVVRTRASLYHLVTSLYDVCSASDVTLRCWYSGRAE